MNRTRNKIKEKMYVIDFDKCQSRIALFASCWLTGLPQSRQLLDNERR